MYFLKAGAPIVVVYNISESIHNGIRATFLARDGGQSRLSGCENNLSTKHGPVITQKEE